MPNRTSCNSPMGWAVTGSLCLDMRFLCALRITPALLVFLWRHSLRFFKCFGKIKAALETDGVGDCRDGQICLAEQIAGFFDTELRQVFFWGNRKDDFKGTEQVASAQSYVIRDVFYRDRIGIVGSNIFHRLLYISMVVVLYGRVFCPF